MTKSTFWKSWKKAPNYFLFTRCERVRRETVAVRGPSDFRHAKLEIIWPKARHPTCVQVQGIIPDQLRSIQDVCKCKGMLSSPTSCVASNMCASAKECYHPPHPPLTSCVASHMCASARNVIIPPPPTPDQLRSIQHVCKRKECYHPPPPTPDQLRSIQHVCKMK